MRKSFEEIEILLGKFYCLDGNYENFYNDKNL